MNETYYILKQTISQGNSNQLEVKNIFVLKKTPISVKMIKAFLPWEEL